MSDDVTITVHVRDLSGPGMASVNRNLRQLQHQANQMGGSLRIVGGQLGTLTTAANNAGNAFGSGGGSLRGQLIGVGAAIGTTLLPTIGALSPMLFGLAGIGGAAALAMKDLKEEAKKLKPEFEALQKTASKAVMPGVKRAMDDVKGAMKGLHPVVKEGGKAFGDIVEKAAAFANSPAFKASLLKNVQMGSAFFSDFTGSLLTFTQAFMDFGTKSQPSLDAFQNLFGGLLDTGLPSMFKEMEQGIQGSSDFLNGLATFINSSLLPSLGKMAGAWAETFGPFFEQLLVTAGGALNAFATVFSASLEASEPLVSLFTDSLRALNEVAAIGFSVLGSLAKVLGEALLGTLQALSGDNSIGSLTDQFTGFSDWVQDNQTGIRLAFTMVASGIISMLDAGLQTLPVLTGLFKMFAEMSIASLGAFLTVLSATFSGIPGMGDFFKGLKTDFDEAAAGWLDNLDTMQQGVTDFAAAAGPNLDRAKLSLNVDQAQANLDSIKEQLQDPELTKERKAELTADKEQAEEMLRLARASLRQFDQDKAESTLSADPSPFFRAVGSVTGTKINGKSVRVAADTSPFRTAVGGLAGRVLGTSYINVEYRKSESNLQKPFKNANGSVMRFYADGGTEQHVAQIAPAGSWRVWGEPETGGEAYIPLAPAKRGRSRAIAEETVGILGGEVQWFAKGGMSDAMKQARSALRGQFNISTFGRAAGYQRTGFEKALGAPSDVGALVTSLNEAAKNIRAAFSGKTESRLMKQLDGVGRSLIKYEKQLTSVNKALETAKTKLSDLKTSASQLSTSVRGGVLQASDITSGTAGKNVTVGGILQGLTDNRDKASAFASALKQLQSKGLSGSLIQQIAEAGINGGGLETAGALLSAGSNDISAINSLQSQITSAATAAGKTSADAVYGAAIKAQTAATARLQKSQDKLEATMAGLAKTLERAISRAMGGKASGGIVGAAASGGIRGGLTWVGEHEPELLQLPVGSRVWSGPDSRRKAAAWESMLTAPRRPAAASASAGGGGTQTVIVHQTITLDGKVVARAVFEPLKEEIRGRGGNVQNALGQRER